MRATTWWAAGVVAMAFVVGSQATAQGLLPWDNTYDLYMADTGVDCIFRFADLDQDLDLNGVGEPHIFYTAALSGGPNLGNASTVCLDTRGRLYVTDTTTSAVYVMIDKDGDGSAFNSATGEWKIYFDSTNASGIAISTPMEARMDVNHVLWMTHASNSTNPLDGIVRAEDLNNDGDCQDAGELTVAYDSLNPSAPYLLGAPFALAIQPVTGFLYVSDVNPDFVYRMIDGNLDGDFYDAGETIVAYSGTAPSPAFGTAATLTYAPNGDLYMADSTGDQIIAMRDGNLDGDFEDPGEAWVFAAGSTNPLNIPTQMNGIAIDEHGRVFGTESGSAATGMPDSLTMFQDLNNDGDADDPGESMFIYDDTVGPMMLTNPREICLVPRPRLSSPKSSVSVGTNLTLDFHAVDSDQYQLVIGLNSLGLEHPLPPYGTLSHDILFIAAPLTLDANGDAQWVIPVPPTLPTPLPIHMSIVAGKNPYRYYLSKGIVVTFTP